MKEVSKAASKYELAVKYEFRAEEDSEMYKDWKTTFYISIDLPDKLKGSKVSMALAGYYESELYKDGWQLVTLTLEEGEPVDLLQKLGYEYGWAKDGKKVEFPYWEVKSLISPFTCGVVDLSTLNAAEKLALFKYELDEYADNTPVMPAGANLTVELRMENGEEYRTIGVYTYAFPEIEQIG